MRTTPALIIVFAFATGVLMFQMSGVAALFDGDPASGLDSGDEFDERANDSVLDDEGENDGFSQDARGDSELLGFIIGAGGIVFDYVGLLVLFPVEMAAFMPWWAAYPIGLFLQTIAVFGVLMFFAGRVWQ